MEIRQAKTEGNVIGTTRYGKDGFKYYTDKKDVQGSTTSVVGQDGSSPVAYDYDDFGVTRSIGDSAFFNEICYTGGIYDVSTGLHYLNARYYDPKNGRFITQDTYRGEINEPDTQHLYTYCSNNPINYVDPSGHNSHVIGEPTGIKIIKGIAYAILTGATIIYNGTMWVKDTMSKKSKKYTYYNAMIKNHNLYLSNGISKTAAKNRLKNKKDVWCMSKSNAESIANSASSR